MEQVNYNSGEVLESLNNKLDRDFNNMAVNSVNFAKYSNNVTNCITEIPQDIKLELVDGTLTLKAGSKVYVPNGSGVFDEVVISDDSSSTYARDTKCLIFYNNTNKHIYPYPISMCASGTDYLNHTGMYYHTTDNIIYLVEKGSIIQEGGYSLALGLATPTSDGDAIFTSIDQVFNGFGYIGSTVFALPGVKGLIPNGRNEDGSLNNIEITVPQVQTFTHTSGTIDRIYYFCYPTGSNLTIHHNYLSFGERPTSDNKVWYDDTNNIVYFCENWGDSSKIIYVIQAVMFGWSKLTNSVISDLQTKLPFYTIDHNDSSWISQQAMPSGKYVDLEFGATGTSYTAPANGWFWFKRKSDGTNTSLSLENYTKGYMVETAASLGNPSILLPVAKNDVVRMWWINGATDNVLRFYYAEGEK